jgi:hypothetical protein
VDAVRIPRRYLGVSLPASLQTVAVEVLGDEPHSERPLMDQVAAFDAANFDPGDRSLFEGFATQ